MGWKQTAYGFWGDDTQDITDEFLQRFVKAFENNNGKKPAWTNLIGEIAPSAKDFGCVDVPNNVTEKVCSGSSDSIDSFLFFFSHAFRQSVLRDPTWSELENHLAIAGLAENLPGIPEDLGEIDFVEDETDITASCFVCHKEDSVTRVVRVNNNPVVYMHHQCLCPSRTVEIELELEEELYAKLVKQSTRLNVPINCFVASALNWALDVHEKVE